MEDFKEVLEEWTSEQLKNYDLGTVTAELQNIGGRLLSQCDDEAFKLEAVASFKNRVMGY